MEILHRKAAVQKAFSNIGKTNGSKPPESANNTFAEAYELFVSKDLKSMAEKRYEQAKKNAERVGVLDMSKAVEGSEITTYQSEHMDISLKTAQGGSMLDRTQLKNHLMVGLKMSDAEAEAVIEAGSKPRKGAVNINISMK